MSFGAWLEMPILMLQASHTAREPRAMHKHFRDLFMFALLRIWDESAMHSCILLQATSSMQTLHAV